jgi:hypothetical protein
MRGWCNYVMINDDEMSMSHDDFGGPVRRAERQQTTNHPHPCPQSRNNNTKNNNTNNKIKKRKL